MQNISVATGAEIGAFFAARNKFVLSFIGYSTAGYENADSMLGIADTIMDTLPPRRTIINIGATRQGIGAIYPLARRRGFETTGIVSSLAGEQCPEFSPCVDHIFLVADESWGGIVGVTGQLSPTSLAMIDNSDEIVGIGGGTIGGQEMLYAKSREISVRFLPADLNHHRAMDKAKKKGLAIPKNFKGAANAML